MKLISRLLVAAIVVLMVLSDASEVEAKTKSDRIDHITASYVDAMAQVYQMQVDNFIAGVQRAKDEAAAAEAARVTAEAEEAAAIAEAARRQPQQVQVQASSSGCCGSHSDAWWHGVSICEQSGNNNPFFGYFSIMDGSAGGKDWGTQVAMANAIIARAGDRAWAASCVAAGYNASPGG